MDKEIEKIEQDFGKDQTIFEILNTENSDKKTIMLKKGSWKNRYPWFGIDADKNIYSVLSLKSLTSLINSYKTVARENFDLKLEKSILQRIPIDFGDVWIVCMDEIKKVAKKNQNMNTLNINFDAVVEKVKSEHPNLFVDIENLIKKDNK